jgi:hypothetical protein
MVCVYVHVYTFNVVCVKLKLQVYYFSFLCLSHTHIYEHTVHQRENRGVDLIAHASSLASLPPPPLSPLSPVTCNQSHREPWSVEDVSARSDINGQFFIEYRLSPPHHQTQGNSLAHSTHTGCNCVHNNIHMSI